MHQVIIIADTHRRRPFMRNLADSTCLSSVSSAAMLPTELIGQKY